MTQLDERGVKVIDARNKHHGGIRPGDVVEHPEHGKGVVQHLDHVHDEVVYKNHEGSFIGVHHSTLNKMNEVTEGSEPHKDASHFDHYLYHFRKSLDNKDDETSKTHRAKAQEFLSLHTQKSRKNPKQKVAVTEEIVDESASDNDKFYFGHVRDYHMSKMEGNHSKAEKHRKEIKHIHGEKALKHIDDYHEEAKQSSHHGNLARQHYYANGGNFKNQHSREHEIHQAEIHRKAPKVVHHNNLSNEHRDKAEAHLTLARKASAEHQKTSSANSEHAAKNIANAAINKAKGLKETMDKTQIVQAILSKDETRLSEAKAAIKSLLTARATQFRADSTKFVARSLFEGVEQVHEGNDKISSHQDEAVGIVKKHGTVTQTSSGIGPHHEASVHHKHLDNLHKSLVAAGFKHHEDDGYSYYHKGTTEVAHGDDEKKNHRSIFIGRKED